MAASPLPVQGSRGPLTPPQLKATWTRARARAAVAKSAALFVLPLPLLFASIAALVADDAARLGLAGAALACFWGAGALAWRGALEEMRYTLGEQPDLDRVPRKLLSALATAVGAALTALAGGHSLIGVLVFAVVALIGHLCFFGPDLKVPRVTVTAVDGVDVSSVTDQLEQAQQRLRRIDAAAKAIAIPEFTQRLTRITGVGREILAKIARDPRDAVRARRFLHLYLDSTERVAEEYARTHQGVRTPALEDNFRQLLVEMENTFTEQHRRLLESDAVSLDVEIEVLNARLKREGLGEYAEKRS
jgi:5-bromo-4-chloroindolyl phosphate hydrolysis protein